MRAVNLIPSDQRRGGGGGGGATHLVLGVLAAVVLGVGAYVLAVNSVNSKRSELAHVRNDAATASQEAAALAPYRQFAALRQTRVQTVAALAASRFDWQRVMNELSRALPNDVWLTSLVGTVAPGVQLEGANSSGDTGSLRSAVQSPAVELVGCTTSQAGVSLVMARLRLLHGVTRVSLAQSEKTQTSNGTSGGSSSGGSDSSDCRNGHSRFPRFEVVVFFSGPTAPPAGGPGIQPTASTAPAPTAGASK